MSEPSSKPAQPLVKVRIDDGVTSVSVEAHGRARDVLRLAEEAHERVIERVAARRPPTRGFA